MRKVFASSFAVVAVGATVFASSPVFAEQPWTLDDNVRYMAIGDSFAAGKGAIPVTSGFAYLLYQEGVFGPVTNVTFANSAVPGSLSDDVLAWQVPAAIKSFKPNVVTVYVGLNDLGKNFAGANPTTVLTKLGQNLGQILCGLKTGISPSPLVIVGNPPEFPWLTEMNPQILVVIQSANQIIAQAATSCGAKVADVRDGGGPAKAGLLRCSGRGGGGAVA